MADRVQLKEPGSELVMVVTAVRPELVEKNEYYLFGNGSKELLVPQSSVMGQLTRLGVDSVNGLVGKPVKFSRSTKMSRAGKPYWNLDIASGAETAAGVSPPANVGAPPAEPPAEKPKLTGLYKQATEFVLKEIVPLYEKAELGLTDETVAACVQTLFIAAAKER